MKRGKVWMASAAGYAGKPRPAVIVIVQDDRFDGTASVTICAFATDDAKAPLFRLPIAPSDRNGLRFKSQLMADKLATVRKERLGKRLGRLDDEDVVRLNRAILVFLGMA